MCIRPAVTHPPCEPIYTHIQLQSELERPTRTHIKHIEHLHLMDPPPAVNRITVDSLPLIYIILGL